MFARSSIPGWLLLAAAGLGGVGIYNLLPESPSFVVEQPDRVFNDLPSGQQLAYTYRIQNKTDRPIRIVGAEFT